MHNHLRHLVVNFLVSKLFTRVGPRAAFVIRNVEMVPRTGLPQKLQSSQSESVRNPLPITIHNPIQFKLMVTLEYT